MFEDRKLSLDGISWDSLARRGREDREIEVRSKGRKDIQKAGVVEGGGGEEGSCIAEATEVEAEVEGGREDPLWWHSSTRRSEKLRRSWASPPLPFSGPPPPPLLAHPV